MRLAFDLLVALVLCLLASEALLRVPGLFAATRGELLHGARRAHVLEEASGEKHRVVCLGDSATFGAGVDEQESYPAQLELQLERWRSGGFEVLNFGVTGLDSAMARERLKVLLRRLEPGTVVVSVGSNDFDVGIELGGEGPLEEILARLAGGSRLALMGLSELQDRRIERSWEFATERLGPAGAKPLPPREGAETRARIEHNLEQMVRLTRDAGVALILVTYPGHATRHVVANRAMAQSAARHGLALVEAAESIKRVPPEQRRFLWALHPNAQMYAAIAEDVATLIAADRGESQTR